MTATSAWTDRLERVELSYLAHPNPSAPGEPGRRSQFLARLSRGRGRAYPTSPSGLESEGGPRRDPPLSLRHYRCRGRLCFARVNVLPTTPLVLWEWPANSWSFRLPRRNRDGSSGVRNPKTHQGPHSNATVGLMWDARGRWRTAIGAVYGRSNSTSLQFGQSRAGNFGLVPKRFNPNGASSPPT